MPEHQQIQQSTESKSTVKRQATPRIQTPVSHPMAIIQRARINPKSLTHADIMQLQRTIGNRAVGRLLSEIRSSPMDQQAPVQRQEIPEEEEPLQGKFENKPDQMTCPSCFAAPIVQRQEIPEEEEPLQGKFESIQRQEIPEGEESLQTKKENNTGMPDNLKAGVENLSGIDMSDVRVHYNSDKPAEVGALAYTQGTNIHVAPGQEKYLPHEAWHVVQQAQGRVQPTMQLKDGFQVNDDEGLEREADSMGRKSLQQYAQVEKQKENKSQSVANGVSLKQTGGESIFQFIDNRPEAIAQRKQQGIADSYTAQQHKTLHNKESKKGLSDNLKSGIETLSDYSMDDVKFHHNTDNYAHFQAISDTIRQLTDLHFSGSLVTQMATKKEDADSEMERALAEGTVTLGGEVDDDEDFDLFAEPTEEEKAMAASMNEQRKAAMKEEQRRKEEEWRAKAAKGPSTEDIIALKNQASGKSWDYLSKKYMVAAKTRSDRKDRIEEWKQVVGNHSLSKIEEVTDFVFQVAQDHPLEDNNKRFAFECGVAAYSKKMSDEEAVQVVTGSNQKLN